MWSFAPAGLNDTPIHCLTSWSRLGSNWCKREDGRRPNKATLPHPNLSPRTQSFSANKPSYCCRKNTEIHIHKNTEIHIHRNTDSQKDRNTCDISSPFPTQAIFECKEVLHCCRALLLAYLFNEPLLKNWIPTFARVALIYGFKWPQRLNSLIFLLLSFAIKWIL